MASRTRICGSKVKTGCITCKIRRVKCDEDRPSCQRCLRAGKTCQGYVGAAPRAQQHRDVMFIIYDPRAPGAGTALQSHQRRSLDYFLHRTATEFGGGFSPALWSQVVMRLAANQPAVQSAAVAVSIIHEQFTNHAIWDHSESGSLQRPAFMSSEIQFAMQEYGKALRETVKLIGQNSKESSIAVLTNSILFSQIEALQGHHRTTFSHTLSGYQALASCVAEWHKKGTGQNEADETLDVLCQFFIGMGTQMMTIRQDDPSVPPLDLPQLHMANNLPAVPQLKNLDDAYSAVATLLNEIMRTKTVIETYLQSTMDISEVEDVLNAHHLTMCDKFQAFREAFQTLLFEQPHLRNSLGTRIVQINELLVHIILPPALASDEMNYDNIMVQFEELLQYATEVVQYQHMPDASMTPASASSTSPSSLQSSHRTFSAVPYYSPNLGILPALFAMCTRCRHPVLRRRCLELLKTCHRRESVWDSSAIAKIAEEIIDWEENRAREFWRKRRARGRFATTRFPSANHDDDDIQLLTAEDIPETARVGLTRNYTGSGSRAQADFDRDSGPSPIGSLRQGMWEQFLVW